jgi:probable lipoprotein NlpC
MNKTIFYNLCFSKRRLCLLWFLLLAPLVFAAIPIQEIQGITALEARQKLISAAQSFLGTPYRYAGIDRNGLDCSGLVFLSFKEGLNYTVPRTAETIYAWTEKIDTQELAPGDLVFFITAGQRVSHVGIYTGEGRFIHSASEGPSTGVMYSRLDESYWQRTYRGAGRALPWNEEMVQVTPTAGNRSGSGDSAQPESPSSVNYSGGKVEPVSIVWADSGFYTGFGAAWTWGGFFEGAPSPFRGISAVGTVGYKWSHYRAGLELRPEWDRALGVFRLPFTLSFGTDTLRVFVGPAYTFGEPTLSLENQERRYSGGGTWLWGAGFSGALPPIRIGSGAVSIYGELAWQPYFLEADEDFKFGSEITANLRASTGLRYLWRLK